MIDRLIVFGALGDLAARYLLPALAALEGGGHLPDGFAVVGAGRDDLDDDAFRSAAAEALATHADDVDAATRHAVVGRCTYRRVDVTDADQVRDAVASDRPVACHLALPPAVFGPAIDALAAAGLAEGSRIVVEKPFGDDLASARDLNRRLHACFPEDAVFRVDHFLAKQTVQNIVALRFANRFLEPLWNRSHVDRVEIVWDETLTLEGRAGYYDAAGALKDMLQNHLLQLLALVAMEPPATIDQHDLRDRKADVLRAVQPPPADQLAERTVRGRYTAGSVDGRAVPSYVEEEGVDPDRGTETFAEVVLTVENWRWAGVPFRLRTGKALGADRHEIVLHFQPVPHLVHTDEQVTDNRLHLSFNPDRVTIELNVSGPDEPFSLTPAVLETTLANQELPAYGQLLLEVLDGDPLLSIRGDEAEEAWRIMDPIVAGWADGAVPATDYAAGGEGPPPAPGWPAPTVADHNDRTTTERSGGT